jgi:hypothetical protein
MSGQETNEESQENIIRLASKARHFNLHLQLDGIPSTPLLPP